jgi:hypothetical protein
VPCRFFMDLYSKSTWHISWKYFIFPRGSIMRCRQNTKILSWFISSIFFSLEILKFFCGQILYIDFSNFSRFSIFRFSDFFDCLIFRLKIYFFDFSNFRFVCISTFQYKYVHCLIGPARRWQFNRTKNEIRRNHEFRKIH